MSFPHRTAFYDREEKEFLKPKDVDVIYPHGRTGAVKSIRMRPVGEVVEEWSKKNRSWEEYTERYIPLASTGLEDSEGNEIFEGHILETNIYRRINTEKTCVFYGNGHFIAWSDETGPQYRHPYLSEKVGIEYEHKTKIVGHALTDPELVPDSFDVEGYFDLEGE